MLLVHGRGGMDVSVDLSDVVEVAVRNSLLRRQLAKLVQENMQLVLRVQVAQATIAERLERPIGNHRAHGLHVFDELVHLRAWIVDLVVGLSVAINLEGSALGLDCVVEIFGKIEFPWIEIIWWIDRVLCTEDY